MFKVMIADDESWIRKGLRAMIEWERLGLVYDSEAIDGLEAIRLAESRLPDILITDVRMPGIDGLQLAERMLKLSPRIKVLIVSGYSEFEYAKRAIQMDAISYILKPINPTELNKTLEKAIDKLKSEIHERTINSHLPGILVKLAADYLCRGGGIPLNDAFRETLQLRGVTADWATAFLIHYDEAQYDAQTFSVLLEQAAASLQSANRCLIIWDRSSLRLSAVVLSQDGTEAQAYAKNILWTLKKQNVSGIWATLGESVPMAEVQQLGRSYQEAISVAERHVFSRTEDLIPYSREEDQIAFKYPMYLQKKLNELLVRGDTSSYDAVIDEIENYYLHTEGASLKHARSFFLSIVSDAVKLVLTKPSFNENLVKMGFDFCLSIDTFDDLARMADWVRGYLKEIGDFMTDASQSDVHRNVLLAADYIREHFAEEISLHSVSTRFHVTSSYFSSMFKEIIGENFVDFLTRTRMEKAKAYLTNSAIKVGQIGELVGYADSRYFSKLFKKHTGLMPTEYRQSSNDPSAESKERT
ncbi:response regulator [Paenibacillus solisilvae]|uniref:Response regulator n=1 Tax=Paenibacillus solisilvae TaxID=2486751 RepID=A0ABW0W6D9_9BACL